MKVIFLDFDGVLVPASGHRKDFRSANPAHVAQLNRIIAETGAKICISSTWRLNREDSDLEPVSALKRWGCIGEVVGMTPFINEQVGSFVVHQPRGAEIRRWLDDHSGDGIESFVIIDDDADMLSLRPYLVKTQFESGLTAERADSAIEMLNSTHRFNLVEESVGL